MSESSASSKPCAKCGAGLPSESTGGLCPRCMLSQALNEPSDSEISKPTVPASSPRKSWEPPSAEELGRLLPQYRIERLLGRGGMGAVYQGRQVSLDRVVAIKILSNDLEAADASFAERFKNEARALGKLSHPGIVAVHEFGEAANGLLYIVMEFIEGTDVARMIAAQGRLHSEHAMAITAHVCDALAYAHERGIIHRDIKPANIMVSYGGVVKVADFGLAKFSTTAGETLGLTQSGMAMGTLHFMAPEALMLGSAVDHRADIYAVGVMLYQMLTGKLPHGMFELPSIQVSGLDPRYDGIIAKAMREDRALRYQSAREMRHDLDGILTQPVQQVEMEPTRPVAVLPTEARPRRSPAGQPYRPPQHRAPLPVKKKSSAGLVLLTLGLLGAIGAAMFFLGQDRKVPAGVEAPSTVGWPAATAATATTKLASATKDAPFVNTLGMKFVPVPGTNMLMCIHETRRQDYQVYADAVPGTDATWKAPVVEGKPVVQGKDHPVLHVSWEDATAFCKWLSNKEGLTYRLPSDHEWNLAVAIGVENPREISPAELHARLKDTYPWPTPALAGNQLRTEQNKEAHYAAQTEGFKHGNYKGTADGFEGTAPVMSFLPNHLGIYDLGGNVWEWCTAPANATGNAQPLRGCGFRNYSWGIVADSRTQINRDARMAPQPDGSLRDFGFRIVVELPKDSAAPPPVSPSPSLPVSSSSSSATKDAPFVNTLGMKFVPVPITGGPTDKQRVLFSIWETRVQDYEVFARETARHWRKPEWTYGPTHPVSGMTRLDASAFCAWLTEREHKAGRIGGDQVYRLPYDHEWSCAAGIGGQEDAVKRPFEKNSKMPAVFPWNGGWPPPSGIGNYAGQELLPELAKGRSVHRGLSPETLIPGYTDAYVDAAPVGSFTPNQLGLLDLGGNVIEWCADPFGDKTQEGVLRGGSWLYSRADLMNSSARAHTAPELPFYGTAGFRCVLAPVAAASATATTTVSPSPSLPVSSSSSSATKDAPFVNTLGMKFVPVPITGGPTDKQRVLFSIWETRVQDYEVFAKEKQLTRTAPPYSELPDHPVVNVSFNDATTYCSWLTERERKAGWLSADEVYRLPSDHEWSCAVGIGEQEDASLRATDKHLKITDVFPWGDGFPPPAGAGNYNGEEESERNYSRSFKALKGYRDRYPAMAPVGQFTPNSLRIYDLGGNAWEFCTDEPPGVRASIVIRGACFYNSPERELFSSFRSVPPTRSHTASDKGFRLVLAATTKVSETVVIHQTLAASSYPDPTRNTLGMKFAPLPGTKASLCIHETRLADYAAFAAAFPSASPAWKSTSAADNHPVTNVSWEEASAFCAWLSKKENRRYRLPTDREWSIAVGIAAQESASATPFKLNGAVAGVYPWSKAKVATVKAGNYAGAGDVYEQTAPVMSFPANELGFFDLGGNVWEYCADLFNPAATTRVLRGASWMDSDTAALLSSCRDPVDPSARSPFVGFRIVREGDVLHPAP